MNRVRQICTGPVSDEMRAQESQLATPLRCNCGVPGQRSRHGTCTHVDFAKARLRVERIRPDKSASVAESKMAHYSWMTAIRKLKPDAVRQPWPGRPTDGTDFRSKLSLVDPRADIPSAPLNNSIWNLEWSGAQAAFVSHGRVSEMRTYRDHAPRRGTVVSL